MFFIDQTPSPDTPHSIMFDMNMNEQHEASASVNGA